MLHGICKVGVLRFLFPVTAINAAVQIRPQIQDAGPSECDISQDLGDACMVNQAVTPKRQRLTGRIAGDFRRSISQNKSPQLVDVPLQHDFHAGGGIADQVAGRIDGDVQSTIGQLQDFADPLLHLGTRPRDINEHLAALRDAIQAGQHFGIKRMSVRQSEAQNDRWQVCSRHACLLENRFQAMNLLLKIASTNTLQDAAGGGKCIEQSSYFTTLLRDKLSQRTSQGRLHAAGNRLFRKASQDVLTVVRGFFRT